MLKGPSLNSVARGKQALALSRARQAHPLSRASCSLTGASWHFMARMLPTPCALQGHPVQLATSNLALSPYSPAQGRPASRFSFWWTKRSPAHHTQHLIGTHTETSLQSASRERKLSLTCEGPTAPTHLAGAELADEQRAPLRVLAPVQAVQLGCHLVQLLVRIVELGQQMWV